MIISIGRCNQIFYLANNYLANNYLANNSSEEERT